MDERVAFVVFVVLFCGGLAALTLLSLVVAIALLRRHVEDGDGQGGARPTWWSRLRRRPTSKG